MNRGEFNSNSVKELARDAAKNSKEERVLAAVKNELKEKDEIKFTVLVAEGYELERTEGGRRFYKISFTVR